MGYDCSLHKAKLRNTTDSTDDLIGSNVLSDTTNPSMSPSLLSGKITIAGSKDFELQHQAATSVTDGFGRACNFGVEELYADLKIWEL